MGKIIWEDRTDQKTPLGVTYEADKTIYNTLKEAVNDLYDGDGLEDGSCTTVSPGSGDNVKVDVGGTGTKTTYIDGTNAFDFILGGWNEIAKAWKSIRIYAKNYFYASANNNGSYVELSETGGGASSIVNVFSEGNINLQANGELGLTSTGGAKYTTNYKSAWDALSAALLARKLVDYGYTLENFLSKLEAADQTVASNVEFEKQVGVSGSESTSSATIAINWTTGTNSREIDITGNISSFTTTEEKAAGNYDAWLVNDGSVRTVVVPTDWLLIPGGDTHDTAANAINLYQFKVSPSGTKKYIIKNM